MRRISLNKNAAWCWYKNIAQSVSVMGWFLLLGGCATVDPFANLEEWKEIQSKNFIVYTNAKEKVALNVVKEFEVFRATALRITTIPPFEEIAPVRIYLFKDKNSFAPFRPSENAAGYFISGKNYIAIYAIPFEENPQFPIVYHEYIHYLISKHPATIPSWFNEGLATMFETFEFNRGLVTFGNPQYDRWMFMKSQASWIPMKEFLSDQTNYLHDNGFAHAHSQAWALMHYFIFGNKQNMDKLGEYIYLVNNGYDYDKALLSTFGMTPEELLREVRSYISKETLPYSTMKLDDIAIDHHHHTRSLKEDEARQVIRDLKGLVEDFRKTASH
ncbi:MAG: DUF1570 domain-containing protein [Nitrosomonas sp.]|nr:DUF1570 domain-containing protein [Nitrosomonas sp.]MBP6076692.1 DUF1570 domain-containing protein [Nitrosomonas sp.]